MALSNELEEKLKLIYELQTKGLRPAKFYYLTVEQIVEIYTELNTLKKEIELLHENM